MLECRLAVVFGFIFRNKDGIAGCAVAQHCFNDDQQSQWENGDFDPVDLKPLKILLQKLDTLITSPGQHACQILWESA